MAIDGSSSRTFDRMRTDHDQVSRRNVELLMISYDNSGSTNANPRYIG